MTYSLSVHIHIYMYACVCPLLLTAHSVYEWNHQFKLCIFLPSKIGMTFLSNLNIKAASFTNVHINCIRYSGYLLSSRSNKEPYLINFFMVLFLSSSNNYLYLSSFPIWCTLLWSIIRKMDKNCKICFLLVNVTYFITILYFWYIILLMIRW